MFARYCGGYAFMTLQPLDNVLFMRAGPRASLSR